MKKESFIEDTYGDIGLMNNPVSRRTSLDKENKPKKIERKRKVKENNQEELINSAKNKIIESNLLDSIKKEDKLEPNQGKNLDIKTKTGEYSRIPIKTPLVMESDDLTEIIKGSLGGKLSPGDTVFVSEKIVAITQGRAIKISDIHPTFLATFLSKFVTKSKRGIGLGIPQTMQMAIEEAGAGRILLATALSAITKPFGLKGVFYRVAGNDVNAIDGPCGSTIPPYNGYAVLGPVYPDTVAENLSFKLGVPVVIVDANDFGVNVLGKSHPDISAEWCSEVFKDNPLGQNKQQTPVGIVRKNISS